MTTMKFFGKVELEGCNSWKALFQTLKRLILKQHYNTKRTNLTSSAGNMAHRIREIFDTGQHKRRINTTTKGYSNKRMTSVLKLKLNSRFEIEGIKVRNLSFYEKNAKNKDQNVR